MGRVGAGPVGAAFYNFHPAMVRQAVPACWEVADPEELILIRARAAAAALAELCQPPALEGLVGSLPTLRAVVGRCDGTGRILAGANRAVSAVIAARLGARGMEQSAVGVAEAWQACTTLREHRGHSHVAALVGHDLSGLQAHLLAAGVLGVPPEVLRDNRGWSEAEWSSGLRALVGRGLLGDDGHATEDGCGIHAAVEAQTNDLAQVPFAHMSDQEVALLLQALRSCAAEVQSSGLLPFPNPMGLPTLN
ncbi:MAG TPA: hypothetical protein VHV57_18545 [Acidimicrobiales bacterium]|nr:hypothetical protein [Acidimicrobiales bacterium]